MIGLAVHYLSVATARTIGDLSSSQQATRCLYYYRDVILEITPHSKVVFHEKEEFQTKFGKQVPESLKLSNLSTKQWGDFQGYRLGVTSETPKSFEIVAKEVHRISSCQLLLPSSMTISKEHGDIVFENQHKLFLDGNDASKFKPEQMMTAAHSSGFSRFPPAVTNVVVVSRFSPMPPQYCSRLILGWLDEMPPYPRDS